MGNASICDQAATAEAFKIVKDSYSLEYNINHAQDGETVLPTCSSKGSKEFILQPLLCSEQEVEDLPMLDTEELPDATIAVEVQRHPIHPSGSTRFVALGISTRACNWSHCIKTIYSGSVMDTWNRENPGKEVQPGDYLVEINGIKHDVRLMQQTMTSEPQLCMKFIAAEVIEFVFDKSANDMLGIKTRAGSKVHQITSVTAGGLFDTFKYGLVKGQATPKIVQVGDYIVEVNGKRDNAEVIRQEWLSSSSVKLLIMRPRQRAPANEEKLKTLRDEKRQPVKFVHSIKEAEDQDG